MRFCVARLYYEESGELVRSKEEFIFFHSLILWVILYNYAWLHISIAEFNPFISVPLSNFVLFSIETRFGFFSLFFLLFFPLFFPPFFKNSPFGGCGGGGMFLFVLCCLIKSVLIVFCFCFSFFLFRLFVLSTAHEWPVCLHRFSLCSAILSFHHPFLFTVSVTLSAFTLDLLHCHVGLCT